MSVARDVAIDLHVPMTDDAFPPLGQPYLGKMARMHAALHWLKVTEILEDLNIHFSDITMKRLNQDHKMRSTKNQKPLQKLELKSSP